MSKPFDTGQKITNMQQAFRDDFGGVATTSPNVNSNWQVTNSAIATSTAQNVTPTNSGPATGMTVNIDGTSNLKIVSGTTASQTTYIQSAQPYTVPFRVAFNWFQSARVTNTDVYLEIVNASGDMVAGWQLLGSASATSGTAYTMNSSSVFTSSIGVISSIGQNLWCLDVFPDECHFVGKNGTTSGAVQDSNHSSLVTKLPDPQQQYYIRIRVTNGTTAPAASSTITIDAISVQDISSTAVEITGGRGSTAGSQAVPTYLVGAASYTQAVSGGVSTYGTTLYATGASTNTSLGASAMWTSGAVTLSNYYAKIRATAWSDQPGTLYIDVSYNNGANWYTYATSAAISAGGGYISLDVPTNAKAGSLVVPQFRARFVNGATAQTVFYCDINQIGM